MKITTIKTKKLLPPQDDLLEAIYNSKLQPTEKSIVVISSKVISIWQGHTLPDNDQKDKLATKEADWYLPRSWGLDFVLHTIKNGVLIGSGGVDRSNSNGFLIPWPHNPQMAAQTLQTKLQTHYQIKTLGVLIVDSRNSFGHRGVTGVAIGWSGFNPVLDNRHQTDIFKQPLKFSQTNVADSLAAAAVLLMGETNEQTPVALITDLSNKLFEPITHNPNEPYTSFEVPLIEDAFWPVLKQAPWQKGGSNPTSPTTNPE
ncbi:MAG: coenzyme F420-0:L-glutamate ligase [Patescibacteria group bacterium]